MDPELQSKLVNSLIIIFVLVVVRVIIIRVVRHSTEDVRTRYNWRKISAYVAVFLGFLLVGRIWFQGIQSVATFLGLLSAGLAIALKDILAGLAGWVYILWMGPFSVGDRIQIGSHSGDVIDIRPFQFTMLEIGNWVHADQSTGRIIHISNSLVFSQSLINYGREFKYIWDEINVVITFESNWKKAKSILQNVADKIAKPLSEQAEKWVKEADDKLLIQYSILTPIVYTSVVEYGVSLSLRFLVEPKRRRDLEQAVWEKILVEFSRCDNIHLAYPTRRIYDYQKEVIKETEPNPDEK
jgi:small-conductance mechanosensitive channel